MKTLSQKIWDSHIVHEEPGAPSLLYIDLHLVHEVTRPRPFPAFASVGSKSAARTARSARSITSIPTTDRSLPILDPIAAKQVTQFEANCAEFGIPCFGVKSEHQVSATSSDRSRSHAARMTVVCGDSPQHARSLRRAGLWYGTSEVETFWPRSVLLQRRSTSFRVRVDGTLKTGVGAKDIILA